MLRDGHFLDMHNILFIIVHFLGVRVVVMTLLVVVVVAMVITVVCYCRKKSAVPQGGNAAFEVDNSKL